MVFCVVGMPRSFAGAPFATDDPQTPDQGHVEFDLAARYSWRQGEASGVPPCAEVDYALTSRLALHVLAANAFDRRAGERLHMGFGDTELGAKYRFLDQMGDTAPFSAAIYPVVTAHTGDAARGLGNGRPRLFLPLWLQREIGRWKFFGGGGYWVNPGGDNRNFGFVGIGMVNRLDELWSIGGELFHATADKAGGRASTGFNLGAIHDFTEQHHLLFSAGRGIQNAAPANRLSVFLGYQLTL